MNQNTCICDQCKQPIDPTKGGISLQPLRGGLYIVLTNGQGGASKQINQQVDLCDQECLGDWVKAIAASIKPAAASATAAAPGNASK